MDLTSKGRFQILASRAKGPHQLHTVRNRNRDSLLRKVLKALMRVEVN